MHRRYATVWLILAILIYTWVAGWGAAFYRPEIFGIFNWSLFSIAPDLHHDYSLRIHEVNGTALHEPTWIAELDYLFPNYKAGSSKQLRAWGTAIENGNLDTADKMQQIVENLFNHHQQIRYELVARAYYPLELWNEGKYKSLDSLGVFDWVRKEN